MSISFILFVYMYKRRKTPTTHLITSTGKLIVVLSSTELVEISRTGRRLRAFCPVHGSDHQRSLSIDLISGWGHCFACHALVVVEDFNPDLAYDLLQRWGKAAPRAAPGHVFEPETRSSLDTSEEPGSQFTPKPASEVTSASPASQFTASSSSWQHHERIVLTFLHEQGVLHQALSRYELCDCWQAQAYLATRQIPLDVALEQEVGYLPHELLALPDLSQSRALLRRWVDRLIFPLFSPEGIGYIGRTLWRWQIGMDERVHAALLESQLHAPRRWIKTRPAGWFCVRPVTLAACVVVVEGAFDRLALLSAGFAPDEVLALTGTALEADWLPSQVKGVLLALDSDAAGIEATHRLTRLLEEHHIHVACCPPPQDGEGKDWSERWRRSGERGIDVLIEAYIRLGSTLL